MVKHHDCQSRSTSATFTSQVPITACSSTCHYQNDCWLEVWLWMALRVC